MNAKQRQLRVVDYVEHMLEASRTARGYIEGIDKAEFLETRMIQQAVILNLIVICEASVQIETEFPNLPRPMRPFPGKSCAACAIE
jgi:uncharacterized protein with HEPN domain